MFLVEVDSLGGKDLFTHLLIQPVEESELVQGDHVQDVADGYWSLVVAKPDGVNPYAVV